MTAMAAPSSSRRVVYAALLGNLLIGLTKFGAAWWTGSSGMLSEAVHSLESRRPHAPSNRHDGAWWSSFRSDTCCAHESPRPSGTANDPGATNNVRASSTEPAIRRMSWGRTSRITSLECWVVCHFGMHGPSASFFGCFGPSTGASDLT